jgi:hypothetical protein
MRGGSQRWASPFMYSKTAPLPLVDEIFTWNWWNTWKRPSRVLSGSYLGKVGMDEMLRPCFSIKAGCVIGVEFLADLDFAPVIVYQLFLQLFHAVNFNYDLSVNSLCEV